MIKLAIWMVVVLAVVSAFTLTRVSTADAKIVILIIDLVFTLMIVMITTAADIIIAMLQEQNKSISARTKG